LTCDNDLYACHEFCCCDSLEQCCGGVYEAPFCCAEGTVCASDGITTSCAIKTDDCWYGMYESDCTSVNSLVDDDWCINNCSTDGWLLADACKDDEPDQYCTCECADEPVIECLSLTYDADTCEAIDPRATTEWC